MNRFKKKNRKSGKATRLPKWPRLPGFLESQGWLLMISFSLFSSVLPKYENCTYHPFLRCHRDDTGDSVYNKQKHPSEALRVFLEGGAMSSWAGLEVSLVVLSCFWGFFLLFFCIPKRWYHLLDKWGFTVLLCSWTINHPLWLYIFLHVVNYVAIYILKWPISLHLPQHNKK